MIRYSLPGIAAVAIALGLAGLTPAQHPPVAVQQVSEANGWQVYVSFGRDPKAVARAAHVWTLQRAREVAEQIQQEFPEKSGSLSVANIQIRGKDGDGQINPDVGPHPSLPDWPMVEQIFRTRNKQNSKALDQKLGEIRSAYEKAKKPTEELMRLREPIPIAKEQALRPLYKNYNDKVDELERDLMKGVSSPLPRLNLPDAPYLYEYVKAWDEAKQDQFLAESLAVDAQRRKTELQTLNVEIQAEQKQISSDRVNGKNADTLQARELALKELKQRYERDAKAMKEDAQTLGQLNKAANSRLNGLENALADSTRVLPAADAFASKPGGASYTADASPKVFKTNANGKPLAEDKQPQGYPKSYRQGDKLASDEKLVIEPSLKVTPLDRVPENVKAGMYGKVVDVDKKAGGVTVQVDESGSKIQLIGLDPKGINPGDYVQPATVIGNWRSTSGGQGTFRLTIRAVNPRNQFVAPGPVLNYARQTPIAPNELQRQVPEVDQTPTDESARLPEDGDGKYETQTIVMDENAPREGVGSVDADRKKSALDAKELVAKRELERQKEAAERQTDESGILKAKIKAVEGDLETARNKLKLIDAEGSKSLTRARELAERKKQLDKERDQLKKDKADLEKEATRVKGTKNNKEIDAFNEKVKKHNASDDKLQAKGKELEQQQQDLRAEIASAQRDRQKAEQQSDQLKQEKSQLQSKLRTAEAEAMTTQSAVQKQEDALKSIADERQQLQERLEARKGPATRK